MGFRRVLFPMDTDYGDHAKAAKDIMKAGVDLWCGPETAESLGLTGHRLHILEPLKQFRVGLWDIKPFSLVHDVENFGFLMVNGSEKILYAIDTNYIPNRFRGLTAIMIGVDYDTDILKNNVEADGINIERAKRTLKNHMDLETAIEFFKANDLRHCKEIHLLHLSNTNSNEKMFKEKIQSITGIPVYVA